MLNGLPFVQFRRSFVTANVTGARRVQDDLSEGEETRSVKTQQNLADVYWQRNSDPNFERACKEFAESANPSGKHPSQVSLYEFMSKYERNWVRRKENYVPHITPNFNRIPNKADKVERRLMFLRTLLLVHRAGTTFDQVEAMSPEELEASCEDFADSQSCPKLVREEFVKSQYVPDQGREEDEDEPMDNPRGDQEELHIEPEPFDVDYEQPEFYQRALMPIPRQAEQLLPEEGANYDDAEFVGQARNFDWHADAVTLGITSAQQLREMDNWVAEKKSSEAIDRDLTQVAGLPSDLNTKQLAAFSLLRDFLLTAEEQGLDKCQQILLNIGGGPGTGKSFFLNTLRRYAMSREQLCNRYGKGFIQTAAPTGAASFIIGGVTLHSLLSLPVNLKKNMVMPPLNSTAQKTLQDRFARIGILIIDEKSMIGQRTFYHISERLKEARPHRQEEPFGGVSVVIMGDFKVS